LQRRTKAAKLAPIAVESPQLPRSLCSIASEDLERKAGPKLLLPPTVSLQNKIKMSATFVA